MNSVLNLQHLRLDGPGDKLTSNLSFICKKDSTISIAVCLPGQP